MIIKNLENRNEKIRNTTINGFNIMALLQASALNTDIPDTGYLNTSRFDPANINIEIILSQNGQRYTLVNSNLAIIAHYSTILQGGTMWRKGVTLRPKAVDASHLVTRGLFLYLGGHYNLTGNDEMIITVNMNRGAFGTSVSSGDSFLQVEPNTSVGVQYSINQINVESIQESAQNASANLGENVTRVALLSFETDYQKPIYKSVTLQSDRLDWTAQENELILRHMDKFPYSVADNLLSALPSTTRPNYYPNTFLIHDKDEIDKAKVSIQLDAVNVASSMNYIVWTSFISSQEIVSKAMNLKDKHSQINVNKLPLSV